MMTSETRLLRNRISNVPSLPSSRTATAISENDNSAPPIHSAPRNAAGRALNTKTATGDS